MSQKKKVVIVGAGPGGLAAAMLLAKRGCEVIVLEKKDHVGGRNALLKVGDSSFDTGPTFLMMKFVLEKLFSSVGKNVEDYLELKRLNLMYRMHFDDRTVDVFDDDEKMRAEIEKKFPGEGAGFEKFMQKESKRYRRVLHCLEKDYSVFRRFFHKDFLLAIPYLGIFKTVYQVLGNYFKDEKLKLCFTFQAKYVGMSAWKCPGGFVMLPYVEHHSKIYHVTGGLNKISESMASVAREFGATIKINSLVKKILLDGKTAKGVILEDGSVIEADAVVVNGDFATAMSELFDDGVLKKYSRKNLEKKKYSCSTFMLYLELDKKYDLPHHNIFIAKDYLKNVENIFEHKILSDDFSFYIQNASVTDPTLAPEGRSTLYALVPVPNRTGFVDWKKETEIMKEKVLDALEARAGIKNVRAHILASKIISPDDWGSEYGIFFGATFNLAHNIGQMLYFRPHNRFEEIKNMYLVGGGTHPGSGLPTIYESGRITAELIVKKFKSK